MAELEEEALSNVAQFFKQKQVVLLSSIVFTLALVICILSSIILGIALISSYFGGILVFHSLFTTSAPTPNLLFMLKRRKRIMSRTEVPRCCTICGDSKCKRHKPDLNLYNLQPWAEFRVPQEVDEALEEFLNITLERYVYEWYRQFSEDELFVHEVRQCLRFMIAVLLRRSLKVDLTTLIVDKLIKSAMQHLDCYLHAKRRLGFKRDVEEAVFDYYGSNLHVAMQSRNHEHQYLRLLCQNLLSFLLPRKYMQCKSVCALLREILCGSILLPTMDVIADPDIVNSLLTLFFDKNRMVIYPDSTYPRVELLANFVGAHTPSNKSKLHMQLSPMLNDQVLLFPFMQFLKDEAAINVLQFCLAVEDFNRQILDPDLTPEQLNELHKEAQHLYNTYCSPDAVDRIQLDRNIVDEIRKIVQGPPKDVVKLRTTAPLYKAYDHAYNLLEKTFCPLFHQSDDYFTLLCGSRLTDRSHQSSGRSHKRESSGVSKLGSKINKIRGVFKPATVDGKVFEDESNADLADTAYPENGKFEEEVGYASYVDIDPRTRDLSAWRVSIPNVDTRVEEGWKPYHVYIIDVQRIDVKHEDDPDSLHWRVERRYHEFYVLEAKLIEFHGDLSDAHLPPKKSFGTKGHDFMEARRKMFEEFLQKLLSKPNLRGSDLLFSFLQSGNEFSTTLLPDINLGRMIKTVPMKLLKEKGQHLEPFLQTFMQSTEAAKPKPSKLECRDINYVPPSEFSRRIDESIYRNNADRMQNDRSSEMGHPRTEISLDGIYDYLIYLAVRVFEVPSWFLQLLMAIRMAAKNSFESFIMWFIDVKLEQALVPQRIAHLIHLLKDSLFGESVTSLTPQDKAHRADQALEGFRAAIPESIIRAIGTEKFKDGSLLIFTMLQYPRLNKQLSYVLLDIVVTELFPELAWPSRPSRASCSDK